MECLSLELRKAKSIRELLEGNQKILAMEVRLIGVVLLLIELVTLCFTLYLEDL